MIHLTIVTVVYNDAKGLELTLDNVSKQKIAPCHKQDEYELVIVDGSSNNATLPILEKYSSYITHMVREPDSGVYDAMNKGLKYANGQYVFFLNAGDSFANDNSLSFVIKMIKENSALNKVIFWPVEIYNESGFLKFYPENNQIDIERWLIHNLPNHQAMIFPRDFYVHNDYDLNLIIAADADYKLRALNEYGYIFYGKPLSIFYIGGISSKKMNYRLLLINLKDSIYYHRKHYKRIEKLHRLTFSIVKFILKYFSQK